MVDEVWVPATGDRIMLEGVIVDVRDGFALVTVDGCLPPSTYISVQYQALVPPVAPPGVVPPAVTP